MGVGILKRLFAALVSCDCCCRQPICLAIGAQQGKIVTNPATRHRITYAFQNKISANGYRCCSIQHIRIAHAFVSQFQMAHSSSIVAAVEHPHHHRRHDLSRTTVATVDACVQTESIDEVRQLRRELQQARELLRVYKQRAEYFKNLLDKRNSSSWNGGQTFYDRRY